MGKKLRRNKSPESSYSQTHFHLSTIHSPIRTIRARITVKRARLERLRTCCVSQQPERCHGQAQDLTAESAPIYEQEAPP